MKSVQTLFVLNKFFEFIQKTKWIIDKQNIEMFFFKNTTHWIVRLPRP